MSEPKISVYMITYNNERTVRKALESVRWADEVVVVDSFSDDKTVEICREFTDKVFQRKWPGFRDQYQHAAELTSHPWVLFLDADEEISGELAAGDPEGGERRRRRCRRVHRSSAEPITWGDGFGTEDGIRTARSGSTEGIEEDGREVSSPRWLSMGRWVR